MMKKSILCIVGISGAGKTSFIERLIPVLRRKGLKIGTVKHDVHDRFEMDKPGKDSWKLKKAGASVSIISSPKRVGIVMDVDHDHDPEEFLKFIDVDLLIAEGYKKSPHPKIEILKDKNQFLCKNDKNLIAIITKADLNLSIPQFRTDQIEEVADFIFKYFKSVPKGI